MKKIMTEFLLLIFQLMGLTLIFLSIKNDGADFFPIVLFSIIIFVLFITRILMRKFGDSYIFILVSFLVSLGILIIYRLDFELGIKQGYFLLIAIAIYYIVIFILKRYPNPEHLFYPTIFISYLLFIITLVLGRRVSGAVNWIDLGIFKFQPAEIIKILTVGFLSIYYYNPEIALIKKKDNKNGILIFEGNNEYYLPLHKNFPVDKYNDLWKNYGGFLISIIVYIEIFFLFLQRDLGASVLFFIILFAMQFIYEKDRRVLLAHIALAFVAIFIAFKLFNHVKVRMEAWIRPMDFADGKGYQIIQSQIAIAEGGLFGKGIGLGEPKFIPAVKTDFIFSAICEEMGIFTGIAVILIFLILVYRGFKIALKKPKNLWGILSVGLSILLGTQVFVILGGVIRLIPMTGITLPFISYGGSSLITSFILIALLEVASDG